MQQWNEQNEYMHASEQANEWIRELCKRWLNEKVEFEFHRRRAMEIFRNKICNVIIIIEVSSRNWMCTLLFVYICIPSTELKLNSFCVCSQRGEAEAEAANTKANEAKQTKASNAKTLKEKRWAWNEWKKENTEITNRWGYYTQHYRSDYIYSTLHTLCIYNI